MSAGSGVKLPRVLALSMGLSMIGPTWAGRDLVRFPEKFADGVHYATVNRGNIREEIYAGRAAIDAAKAGKPLPSGTVITLVDYRGGQLFRYVVMEKGTGWGAEYPSARRNGEWEYQAFNADKTVNLADDVSRCFACHQSEAAQDYVFTLERMKAAD